MNILRVHCSPRGRASESYRLADVIVGALLSRYPGARVMDRPLGDGAMSHVDEDYADVIGGHRPAPPDSGGGALPRSERFIQELEAADRVVIGTPMHNYTVPSALKAWIDHIVRARRTFRSTPEGKIGTLKDRPVYVAVSSGGLYGPDQGRQPDFLTPYLTTVLNTIGLHDIAFFSVQGTALGPDKVNGARRRVEQEIAAHFLDDSTHAWT